LETYDIAARFLEGLRDAAARRKTGKRTADLSTPLPRNFLWRPAALADFMRLSLMKGAHANLSRVARQEIRVRSGRDDKSVAIRRLVILIAA
jgi:hypothetical protein